MNATAAIEALRALHVRTIWAWRGSLGKRQPHRLHHLRPWPAKDIGGVALRDASDLGPSRVPVTNAAVAWGVAVGAVLAWDGWLVHGGRTSLTCHARRHPAIAITSAVVLLGHFAGKPQRLRRLDPFAAGARFVSPRSPHG